MSEQRKQNPMQDSSIHNCVRMDGMPTNWALDRITLSDLSAGPATGLHPALEVIRKELFSTRSAPEFGSSYQRLLAHDSSAVALTPGVVRRGAEAYWVHSGDRPIAAMVLHFYDWQLLAPQICFSATLHAGEIVSLSLARFEQLVTCGSECYLAAEVSSMWVDPLCRQAGFAKTLLDRGMAVFDAFFTRVGYGFAMVRGAYGDREVKAIFRYLLDKEEAANGRYGDTGQVVITGLNVPALELSNALGFDCLHLPTHPSSIASYILARRIGMSFIGYSRTASALFGRIWPASVTGPLLCS